MTRLQCSDHMHPGFAEPGFPRNLCGVVNCVPFAHGAGGAIELFIQLGSRSPAAVSSN
jgi:hypothetical protein